MCLSAMLVWRLGRNMFADILIYFSMQLNAWKLSCTSSIVFFLQNIIELVQDNFQAFNCIEK